LLSCKDSDVVAVLRTSKEGHKRHRMAGVLQGLLRNSIFGMMHDDKNAHLRYAESKI
jgi:hypothetical protein